MISKFKVTVDSIVVAVKEQVSSELTEEVIILSFKSGKYYGLNAVGARVWTLVQEPKTLNDIRNVLLEEYEVEPNYCTRDLLALVQELAIAELVEVRNETAV